MQISQKFSSKRARNWIPHLGRAEDNAARVTEIQRLFCNSDSEWHSLSISSSSTSITRWRQISPTPRTAEYPRTNFLLSSHVPIWFPFHQLGRVSMKKSDIDDVQFLLFPQSNTRAVSSLQFHVDQSEFLCFPGQFWSPQGHNITECLWGLAVSHLGPNSSSMSIVVASSVFFFSILSPGSQSHLLRIPSQTKNQNEWNLESF